VYFFPSSTERTLRHFIHMKEREEENCNTTGQLRSRKGLQLILPLVGSAHK
jgi:hypothetical protein